MKSIIIFSILSLLIYSGCEKGTVKSPNSLTADSIKSKKEIPKSNTNEIKTRVFKGIFSVKSKEKHFKDCISKSDFIVAGDGDVGEIEKQYQLNSNNTEDLKMYIEIEGFLSEQANKKSNKMDSVLVVTKFVKAETNITCD